jgi:hypothetical protein
MGGLVLLLFEVAWFIVSIGGIFLYYKIGLFKRKEEDLNEEILWALHTREESLVIGCYA